MGEEAFERTAYRNVDLRRFTYAEIKDRWGLGAQAAQHVIKKTCDACATLRTSLRAGHLGPSGSERYRRVSGKPIGFRSAAAQPYDDRTPSWQMDARTVSIWTTSGRMKDVAYTGSSEQLATLALYRKGESDLLHRDGSLNAPGAESVWRT